MVVYGRHMSPETSFGLLTSTHTETLKTTPSQLIIYRLIQVECNNARFYSYLSICKQQQLTSGPESVVDKNNSLDAIKFALMHLHFCLLFSHVKQHVSEAN